MDGLNDFIGAQRDIPFQWGRQDCCLFAANWVWHVTGVDPAAAWRGMYEDEDGARAIWGAYGGIQRLVWAAIQPLGFVRGVEVVTGAVAILVPRSLDPVCVVVGDKYFHGCSEAGPLAVRRQPDSVIGAFWNPPRERSCPSS